MFGCSLFARFSVSTVVVEPPPLLSVSGQRERSLQTEINGIYKIPEVTNSSQQHIEKNNYELIHFLEL